MSSIVGETVLVLGAGIQGACAALELARLGHRVTLVDEAGDCFQRTSLVNEGKIHLGHVYANDRSLETSLLMLEAACSFASLVERWVGPVPWSSISSTPFVYLVAPDSLLSIGQVFSHYERLDHEYQRLRGDRRHYLATRPATLWTPVAPPPTVDPEWGRGAAATPEVAIEPARLGELFRRAIASHERVCVLYHHRVESVTRSSGGFRVEGTTSAGEPWQRRGSRVVNCLWADRIRIDRQLGLEPSRGWVHRLKYRLLVDLPGSLAQLPSLTVVLGRYGDIVTRPGSRLAYLSWYPSCLRGWSREAAIPDDWRAAIRGLANPMVANEVALATLHAFDRLVPGLGKSTLREVAAGVIVSWGATDIDDPLSTLHERKDIGVRASDGYFSIDTGKLTCAPKFADDLGRRMN